MGAISFLLSTYTIHTLAKFLHVVICFQESSNLRIAREVGIANVAGLHLSWQFAWRFKYQSVIEHLDLYLSSFDIVGSVATGINHHLLYDEFWIVTTGYKLSVLSQEGVLTYLGLDELYRFPDLVQDGSFKDDILDDVHLCANFLVNAFIANETGTTAREELLRVLAEKQDAGNTDIFLTLLVGRYKAIVLSQVFKR